MFCRHIPQPSRLHIIHVLVVLKVLTGNPDELDDWRKKSYPMLKG
jgi:hypothetical protein